MVVERQHVNAIDAAAAGASDGTTLAINVAAMLIAFLAFIAMFDYLLGLASPGLTLSKVFATVFAPVAVLMGVASPDVAPMADLLGTKLVANEFVSFVKLTSEYKGVMSERSYMSGHLRPHGLCQPGVHRHSAWRHRRDGSDPAERFGAPGQPSPAGRIPGDADQRGDRVDAVVARTFRSALVQPPQSVSQPAMPMRA